MDWIAAWVETIDQMVDAIEHAKACGTLNALDRSKQYTEMDNVRLVRAVNDAWTKIRICERSILAKEQDIKLLRAQIRRYRVKNMALTAVLTGLAWEGLKALVPWVVAIAHSH